LEPIPVLVAADMTGWFAFALASAFASSMARWRFEVLLRWSGLAVMAVVVMIASTLAVWDSGNWLPYHALLAGMTGAPWLIVAIGWLSRPAMKSGLNTDTLVQPSAPALPVLLAWGEAMARSAALPACVAVALALRATWGDPQSPWWSVVGLVAISLWSSVLAGVTAKRSFAYVAAILFNLAVSIWAVIKFAPVSRSPLLDLVQINIIALALPAVLHLVQDIRVLRRLGLRGHIAPLHQFAASGSITVLSVLVTLEFVANLALNAQWPRNSLGWVALGAAAGLGAPPADGALQLLY
jgi:hypothetical protein